jgi:PAS domain S-box-containing protein
MNGKATKELMEQRADRRACATDGPLQSDEVFRATLEQAVAQGMEGLALMDEQGTFVYMNQTYAAMYGFRTSELLGKTWQVLYDPDQIALMETQALAGVHAKGHWRGELVGRRKDGGHFYVELSLQRLSDVRYAHARVTCACRDITERKWAEAALKESEERYALALQGSNDGHWDWSMDTNYCYFSPRWKELLGYDDHEMENHHDSFLDRVHPDDLQAVKAAVQAHISHRAPYHIEMRLRHKSGAYRWFRTRGHAMWNANGQAIRMAGVLTDITEHKQAEERFRLVVESAPCGMVMADHEGMIVLINSHIETLFCYRRGELIGQSVDVLIPERYRREYSLHRPAGFTVPSGHPVALGAGRELYGVRKDGTEFPIEVGLNFLTTQEGSMVLSSIVNITERKRAQEAIRRAHDELDARVQTRTAELTAANTALERQIRERQCAEEALLKSHALFRAVAAVSPVGIYRTDRDGQCVYANERWSEITGLTLADAQGNGWAYTVHPDDREPVFEKWRRAVQGGPPFRAEFRFQRADGSQTWVLGQAAAEFDETGTMIGFVGTMTDISSRKRIETIKARENKILELIATGSPLTMILNDLIKAIEEQLPGMLGAIMLVDQSGTRLQHGAAPSMSEEYCRAIDGLPIGATATSCGAAAHFRHAVVVEEIAASSLWASHAALASQHGLRACWSRPIMSRSGGVIGTFSSYFRVKTVPTDVDEELLDVAVHLAGIAIDHAQAEEALVRLNEALQERAGALMDANQELEAFSYSVSHDLRAPLRHLDGFADLLRKHAHAQLDDKGRHYLTTISSAAKRMGVLIDDLLAFSRIGRAEFSRRPVSLQKLVAEVLRDVQSDVQGRPITWNIGALPDVLGDAAMLRLVLANLIGNAVKYTRDCPDTIIDIGHGAGREDEVVVFVRDNGVGFDPQYGHRLFGVFQRLHTAHEFEGNGIGLANVRRIVYRHGGRTWADGRVGAGATFWFSLPRAAGAQA